MKSAPAITTPAIFMVAAFLLACAATPSAHAINYNVTQGSNPGPFPLAAGANTITIDNTVTLAAPAALDGLISGLGDITFTSLDANNAVRIAQINVASTYTGNTTIRSNDARFGLRLGIDDGLPTGTVLTLDPINAGTGRPDWFDLNGFSQELAGITNTAAGAVSAIVNGNTSQDGALIVNNSSNFTYSAFLGPDNAHNNITAVATGILDGEGNNFSLTKDGVGNLTLTKANSYTGDTIILDGVLEIQNAYLADLSDVHLTTGAAFSLNFQGTDIIDELFIDGVGQAVGTWGALGSGADNESGLFRGTGLLQVTTLTIPEPATATLGLLGLGGLMLRRRRMA